MSESILLYSNDRYLESAILDLATNELAIFAEHADPSGSQIVQGSFSNTPVGYAFLYRREGVLWFQFDGRTTRIDDETQSRLEDLGSKRRLVLLRGGGTVFDIVYDKPELLLPIEEDPSNVDEEDFDYLLFLHNLVHDPGRLHGRLKRPPLLSGKVPYWQPDFGAIAAATSP
jgi:hypothetical protein